MTVYLDYNATAPLLPGIFDAMKESMEKPTNPSALHSFGQQAKRWMNQSRREIAGYVDAHPDHVIFTSGGTEANNFVLKGFPWEKVLLSAVVHDSVYKVLDSFDEITVDSEGLLDLHSLEEQLKDSHGQKLISVVLAHNESGVIQPLEDVVHLAKMYKAYVHVDAVQALGKVPLSFQKMGIDFLTLSAHKIGGPQGVGVLVAKDTLTLSPLMQGGRQERGHRSGTENVPGIVGFAESLKRHSLDHMRSLKQWHHAMEEELEGFCNTLHIYGKNVERLSNTTCLSMPFVESATQVMHLDLNGIAVSMGAACSSGRTQISRSLQKMGSDHTLAKFAIRVSSGWNSTEEDFKKFTSSWKEMYNSLGGRAAQ
jgi:cysteine desulfurase